MQTGTGWMEPLKTAPLTEAEVVEIIQVANSDRLMLVGGQSIFFWKSMYASKSDWLARNDVTSEDIDFMDDMPAAKNLASHFKTPLNVPSADDSTPSAANLSFLMNDRFVIVDFMRSIQGVADKDLRNRAVLVNLGLPDGGRDVAINVMHPFDCLVSRLSNINGPMRRIDLHSREQAEASVEIMRCHLHELIELGKPNEACRLLQPLEYVIRDNHVGKNSHRLFGKHVDPASLLREFRDDARLHERWRERTLAPIIERIESLTDRKEARDLANGVGGPGYRSTRDGVEARPSVTEAPALQPC